MAQTLYDMAAFVLNATYYQNYYIRQEGQYYYCLKTYSNSNGNLFAADLDAGFWGGMLYDNGENKPHFLWTPSYGWSNTAEPNVKVISFGDAYTQVIKNGLNNVLMNFNLTFDNIDINEYVAILHFLETRAGAESFIFSPPEPRNVNKRFICKKWSETKNNYNNFSIQANFQEVVY